MKRFLIGASIAYLIALLIGWGMIRLDGSHWLVTLFLFSPRWVAAAPMVLLVPLTMLFCFRWSFLYSVHAAVIAIPILGLQLPMNVDEAAPGGTIRVMTCNLGGGHIWRDEIVQLVKKQDLDLLILQECPTSLSIPLFEQLGWNHRQQYNMAIGSHLELGEPSVIARQSKQHYEVAAAIRCSLRLDESDNESAAVQLVCVHLPTFRPAMEKARQFDSGMGRAIAETGNAYRAVAEQAHRGVQSLNGPLIIAGDFNVPVESVYYRDYWAGFRNAQSDAGFGLGYTKFTRFHGVRIDHLLINERWSVLRSEVGNDFGGDHRPVIVELQRR
jgi:vancomycin resistance protein VanJ